MADKNKMTFSYKYDGLNVVVKLDKDSNLDTVLDAFEGFLKACTYSFNGHLEFVEDK